MPRFLPGIGISLAVCLGLLPSAVADEQDNSLQQMDQSIQDFDREHWSFQPIRLPPIPRVHDGAWPLNPIDRFILAALEQKGWRPSPDALRRRLLRRVYLDVVGVPPGLDEQQRFLDDSSPDAFYRLVDELLSRPGYAERWGRHWLDLVRYAETNGYERDAEKPSVWRYRDYVIHALNVDKPYNRFVLEQLAGDEMTGASTETVIATGYFRLAPWDDEPADPQQDRFDQLDDMVRVTSQTFLGLTLGCCRCHDHKFDALTMHDYYRMVAIFNPLSRPRNGRRELDSPAGSRTQLATLMRRDRRIDELSQQKSGLQAAWRMSFIESGKSGLPREAAAALQTDEKQRSAAHIKLVKQYAQQLEAEAAPAMPTTIRDKIAKLDQQIQRLRRKTPDLRRAYFMTEQSPRAPETRLLYRGRAALPGPIVRPGLPTVLAKVQPRFLRPDAHTSRRRLTLARWITHADNPLTARVIVNRVWQYHFGQAIVRTPSDFGVLGSTPTHPQLLDWLAHWFMHDARWSLKKLHALILSSRTYRMDSRWNSQYASEDPENELFWRFPYRRLEVEAIRDSILTVSDQLNHKMYGPGTYLSVPAEALEGHSDPDKIWKPLVEPEASRRTVYAFVKRSLVVPFLEVLDLCDTTRPTESRNVTSVAPQALTLFNGEFVNRQARHFARRLEREVGQDRRRQIERVYRLALCRPPNAVESAALLQFLDQETDRKLNASNTRRTPVTAESARSQALVQLCRVVLNLNEFVYRD